MAKLCILCGSNATLHKFPNGDNRKLWINFCEGHGVIGKNWNNARVCHRHFTKEDYTPGCRVRFRLSSKAIPTINNPNLAQVDIKVNYNGISIDLNDLLDEMDANVKKEKYNSPSNLHHLGQINEQYSSSQVQNVFENRAVNDLSLRSGNALDQQSSVSNDVHINKSDGSVILNSAISSTNPTSKNSHDKSNYNQDSESKRGRFGWRKIEKYNVPYITRVINGKHVYFVSVRLAEYIIPELNSLSANVYTCIFINSFFISKHEETCLNDINENHCDYVYGQNRFEVGKECVVRMEDLLKLYEFIQICKNKILCKNVPACKQKFGFLLIDSEFAVSYCIINNQIYIPLFYFEKTEDLKHVAVTVDSWNLTCLKFCWIIQGIQRDGLIDSEKCIAAKLEDIKTNLPNSTFTEYWPENVELFDWNPTCVNPTGSWIRMPQI